MFFCKARQNIFHDEFYTHPACIYKYTYTPFVPKYKTLQVVKRTVQWRGKYNEKHYYMRCKPNARPELQDLDDP